MIREIFLVCLAATLALNDEPCYCGQAKRINFGRADETGDRIIGGESTEVNEYPWQADVIIHYYYAPTNGSGVRKCGGSVVSDSWVLTAAHCLEPDLETVINIYLGEYNNHFEFETKMLITKGNQQIIHPNNSK